MRQNSTSKGALPSQQQVREGIKRAKRYLKKESALEYPPALAAVHGLGTKPFHLYSSIGYDRLHALYPGPERLSLKLRSSELPTRGSEIFLPRVV